MGQIKKIFVVGTERSGTKWLTKIIGSQPGVTAAWNPFKDVEEAYFENFNNHFPNVDRIDDYIAMVELASSTYLFEILNGDKEYFYKIPAEDRPENYFQFFNIIIDQYTLQEGNAIWVQKTSPKSLPSLTEEFPDAYFIIIQRELLDNIRSRKAMQLKTNNKVVGFFSFVYQFVFQRKLIAKHLKNQNRVFYIDYKDLKNNNRNRIENLFDFLEINFTCFTNLSTSENTGHSSFTTDKQRKKILSKKEILFIKVLVVFFKLVPERVFQYLFKFSQSKMKMVAGTFSNVMLKYNFRYQQNDLNNYLK